VPSPDATGRGPADPVTASPPGTRFDKKLAVAWILVIYSNLAVYIGIFVLPVLQPIHWIAGLTAVTLVTLSLPRSVARDIPWVFPAALASYAAICLFTYVMQGGGDPVILKQRILSLLLALLAFLVFSSSPAALHAARRALVWVLLLSVVVNFYDITHPLTLVPATSEFATLGRAAGLFMNPNQAGAALVLGLALSLGVVAPYWRLPFLVFVSAGIAVTLSRGALLGLALVIFGLFMTGRELKPTQVVKAVLVIGITGYAAWRVFAAELESRFSIDPGLVLDRVFWILDPSGRSDFSQADRLLLAERGWLQFVGSPFWGNGLGSTELWEMRQSTHNLYLRLASDFGLAGFLMFPLIVASAIGRGRGALTGSIAAAFLLMWGLVSHDSLTEYYMMLGIALMAAINHQPTLTDRS
jgi:O-antigen ligase